MKKKVLLIGAKGRVGSGFIEEYLKNKNYEDSYELILGVHDKKYKKKNFKVKYVSLEDIKSLKKAMKGINVVINLAANPEPKAEFKDLIKPNLIGAYNCFKAAADSKCERVIFASSVHAIKGYLNKKRKAKENAAPKPEGFYGATKAFGEALCYTFSSKYEMSCLGIRIGAYTSNEKIKTVCFSRDDYEHVISQEDMGQLLHKCIIAPKKVNYGIFSGTSKNKKRDMELKYTKKLIGYKPKDDAFKLCKKIKIKNKS